VVTGRHVDVPARLRAYAEEKLAKVAKVCPKAIRVDVEVSRERNPRMSEIRERVQLTCLSRGPAIRAEAAADSMLAAFDLAWAKLESRLRRAADRRRVHRGSRTPISVAAATAASASIGAPDLARSSAPDAAAAAGAAAAGAAADAANAAEDPYAASANHLEALAGEAGEGPMLVREKLHKTTPMTLDQALYEMELVGHDFFLFSDKDSGFPSVVYRRRAYDYGVIRIDTSGADADELPGAGIGQPATPAFDHVVDAPSPV
jgi:ribosomal subunit interface protein